jgi:hypothetical protein
MLRYLYHSQLCTRKALDMLQSHSQYRFLFLTITPYNQVLDKWQQILLPAGIMYPINAALNFFSKSSTLAHNNTPPPSTYTKHTHTETKVKRKQYRCISNLSSECKTWKYMSQLTWGDTLYSYSPPRKIHPISGCKTWNHKANQLQIYYIHVSTPRQLGSTTRFCSENLQFYLTKKKKVAQIFQKPNSH